MVREGGRGGCLVIEMTCKSVSKTIAFFFPPYNSCTVQLGTDVYQMQV